MTVKLGLRSPATIATIIVSWTIMFCGGALCAQEDGQKKDEALDSLIEKLARPEKAGASAGAPEQSRSMTSTGDEKAGRPRAAGGDTPKSKGGDLSSKDRDVDELLEKLGQSKDEPTSEDERARRQPPQGEKPEQGQPRQRAGGDIKKNDPLELQGQDKDLDSRLEEFAGKRRRNRQQPEEESSPLGQVIKQMREVEDRLGKPDTGRDTQGKQKQIVEKIETLIQQLRQSSSSSSSMAMKKMGQQSGSTSKGGPQGQSPGAMAGYAPSSRPQRPTNPKSAVGGKDIWGHLPEELRQEMDNVLTEEPLLGKEDLIRRYYLSLSKRKVVRGE